MIEEVTQIAQGVGGIATAASVGWAIYTYNRNQESSDLFKARHAIESIEKNITEIDDNLSQPQFVALGDEIAKEIVLLKGEDESVMDFSKTISSDEGHDLVARAIHLGRVNCQITEKFRTRLAELDALITDVSHRLPLVGYSVQKFVFYINRTTSLASSPRIYDWILGDPEAMAEHLLAEIDESTSIQKLRAQLGLMAAACPANILELPIGQQLFDESERAIKIIINAIRSMSDQDLKKLSRMEVSLEKKLKEINMEHAADDAIETLKLSKSIFSEEQWDLLVTTKANIIMLVNSYGEQGA